MVELAGTRSLRSLVQTLRDCEPVRIGNLSCELPLAILTLSGQYPVSILANEKARALGSGIFIGGAGGYCPRVRRFILVSRLQA
jgi:hypothetical protein